ncbi:hypothetical protein DERF_011119 [Dermatophagoides farinae]|uniref:Uncharacterized protein n=1 Tax=Dermatophagoides farinae TaxID=6954 RepID=A0A922L2S8_DERFA|nr:hypothetical protein DERF_011119 [Dermatophagoides farinae]
MLDTTTSHTTTAAAASAAFFAVIIIWNLQFSIDRNIFDYYILLKCGLAMDGSKILAKSKFHFALNRLDQ